MTKNERIEKRAVKLFEDFYGGTCGEQQMIFKVHKKSWLKLARKLIRLEDKVSELNSERDYWPSSC